MCCVAAEAGDIMALGDVYRASGARFAYNTQAEADALFMNWLQQSQAAGDWQSAMTFLIEWDTSTGFNLPGSDPAFGGLSSAQAQSFRASIATWINANRSQIQASIAAAQLVTGGEAAVTARAAQGDQTSITALTAAGLPVPPLAPAPPATLPPASGFTGPGTQPGVMGPLPSQPSTPANNGPASIGGSTPIGRTQLVVAAESAEQGAAYPPWLTRIASFVGLAEPVVATLGIALLALLVFAGGSKRAR